MENENKTNEQLKKEFVENIQKLTGKELIERLKSTNSSEVFIIIRDFVTRNQTREINNDIELRKQFKEIKFNAKEAFEFDSKTVTVRDLKSGLSELYQTLSSTINSLTNELHKLKTNMNSLIEEKNKLEENKTEE